MWRRALVISPLCSLLRALTRQEVLEQIEPLASALSHGDATAFMRRIDENAPEREQLRQNVVGLIARYEVTCSVEVLEVRDAEAELDWYMELRNRATQMLLERRRDQVTVRFAGKFMSEIRPVSFFAPARE